MNRPRHHCHLALAAVAAASAVLITACAPWRLWTSVELAREATPLVAHPAYPTHKILVVGDSTAVGTGASSPAESLPGLISQQHPQWHIDNLAANDNTGPDRLYDAELALSAEGEMIALTLKIIDDYGA